MIRTTTVFNLAAFVASNLYINEEFLFVNAFCGPCCGEEDEKSDDVDDNINENGKIAKSKSIEPIEDVTNKVANAEQLPLSDAESEASTKEPATESDVEFSDEEKEKEEKPSEHTATIAEETQEVKEDKHDPEPAEQAGEKTAKDTTEEKVSERPAKAIPADVEGTPEEKPTNPESETSPEQPAEVPWETFEDVPKHESNVPAFRSGSNLEFHDVKDKDGNHHLQAQRVGYVEIKRDDFEECPEDFKHRGIVNYRATGVTAGVDKLLGNENNKYVAVDPPSPFTLCFWNLLCPCCCGGRDTEVLSMRLAGDVSDNTCCCCGPMPFDCMPCPCKYQAIRKDPETGQLYHVEATTCKSEYYLYRNWQPVTEQLKKWTMIWCGVCIFLDFVGFGALLSGRCDETPQVRHHAHFMETEAELKKHNLHAIERADEDNRQMKECFSVPLACMQMYFWQVFAFLKCGKTGAPDRFLRTPTYGTAGFVEPDAERTQPRKRWSNEESNFSAAKQVGTDIAKIGLVQAFGW